MGPPKEGKLFWDRWLREYYQDRVPVAVDVERVSVWGDLDCAGPPRCTGRRTPATRRRRPSRRTAPGRASTPSAPRGACAASTMRCSPTSAGTDIRRSCRSTIGEAGPAAGIRLRAQRPLPPGGRRAGLVGHSYRAKLIGLAARQHTGWLTWTSEGALYAPHTESGFRAPPNKTLLLFFNGLLAKQGLRRARKQAAARA